MRENPFRITVCNVIQKYLLMRCLTRRTRVDSLSSSVSVLYIYTRDIRDMVISFFDFLLFHLWVGASVGRCYYIASGHLSFFLRHRLI
ncbi:hypothetical protein BJX61DRAFT_81423 [Aspergillus egyptiacus]|nr:hypothetical protein BJX61DRAFT_81423 [Aspergillus egyptiacus]